MPIPAALENKLNLPVIGAPLFIISHPPLVIAQCMAGVVGSFPALNARPKEQLDDWLAEITETLATARANDPQRRIAPYAVNQIVHASNDRLDHDMNLCEKHKAPTEFFFQRPCKSFYIRVAVDRIDRAMRRFQQRIHLRA